MAPSITSASPVTNTSSPSCVDCGATRYRSTIRCKPCRVIHHRLTLQSSLRHFCSRTLTNITHRTRARPPLTPTHLIDLWHRQRGRCALTDIPLEIATSTVHTASLDRIDPTLGYTPTNIRWLCLWANRAKTSLPDHQFFTLCSIIVGRHLRSPPP